MNTKALLWKAAKLTDDHFNAYKNRNGNPYAPIEKLPFESRALMYKMLEIDPEKRISLPEILEDQWIKNGVEMCCSAHTASDADSRFTHKHHGAG